MCKIIKIFANEEKYCNLFFIAIYFLLMFGWDKIIFVSTVEKYLSVADKKFLAFHFVIYSVL
jgi:hypothetical protein